MSHLLEYILGASQVPNAFVFWEDERQAHLLVGWIAGIESLMRPMLAPVIMLNYPNKKMADHEREII